MEKRCGVVSADGHCRLMHLPFDLWTKRLPRKFQDDGPRVVQGPDRDGVDAELVNGPYEQISQIKDPELRPACVRAVNDWARELYEESNRRFIMLLPLPCLSPDEAVAELLRVAEFGLPTGVIFDWVFAPEPVMHQMWEPVWAAAAETGMPVNLHAYPSGGTRQIGVGVPGLEPRNQSLMRVANFPMGRWP